MSLCLLNLSSQTITKGILKDPKQNNKRKRTSDQRRISFGSVEWSTFAKDDAVTPTKDRAKAGRESLDFNFDFNFNVDEMEDHLPGDEFTASSIFPSEDDQSGVSMMEEQRPDAVSTWTSKASNLLQWGEWIFFFFNSSPACLLFTFSYPPPPPPLFFFFFFLLLLSSPRTPLLFSRASCPC